MVIAPSAKAQLFSTANHPISYGIEHQDPYSINNDFQPNNGRYKIPYGHLEAERKFLDGHFHTAAATLGDGTLADDAGYFPTNPDKQTSNDDTVYDDDETQAPPSFAPLDFGWDVILFMLLLSLLYAYKIHRKTTTAN